MTKRTIDNGRLIDGKKIDNLPSADLTGQANKRLAVNSTETGLEYVNELENVTLNELEDVTITNPATSEVLIYNDATGKWENGVIPGAGDVVGPSSAIDENIVVFNGVTGKIIKDGGNFNNLVGSATNITGLVSGGELTVNAGDDSLLDVSDAVYYIQGVRYTFDEVIGIANGLTGSETARRYGFSSIGLVSQVSDYSDAQKQTILPIARINSVQGESGPTASIQNPIDKRYFISEDGWRERIRRENIFGALYSETGGEFEESSTSLQVNQDAGKFYDAQGKEIIVPQEDNITANYVYHTGGIPTVVPTTTLIVNTTQYDNGTDLVTMTDNYWKVDTLLKTSKTSNEFFVVTGNNEYATQTEAESEAVNYGIFQNEAISGLIAVARFIVRKNNSSINRISNIIPRIKGNSNASTGVTPLLPTVSNPTDLVTYEDAWRTFTSGALTTGFEITDNLDGTFNIAEGEVVIRSSSADNSTLAVYKVAASSLQSPADNEVTYYYIDYNSGNLIWASGTDIYSYNGTDKMQAFTIGRRGNLLFIVDATAQSVDGNRKGRRRDLEWDGNVQNGYWHSRGGSVISDSGLNILVSSGKFFYGYSPITHIAFDTTVAGTANENVFDYYYNRAAYTFIADSKTINNTQYDLNGVLTTFANNRFRADWIYIVLCAGLPRFIVIMGDEQYNTLAEAQLAPQPATLPAFMDGVGVLVGQTVAQQGISTLVTTTAFGSTFTPGASSSDHTLLSNLGWTGSGHTDGIDSVATFGATGEATSTSLSTFVRTTLNQTIAGIKTFSSFMITPSSAPTTDYQVANKKYVDDSAGGGGIETVKIAGIQTLNTEFFEFDANGAATIGVVSVALQVKPVGADFIVTWYKNGVSVGTTTILTTATATNNRYKTKTTLNTALVDTDVFTGKITSVGSDVAGAEFSSNIGIS